MKKLLLFLLYFAAISSTFGQKTGNFALTIDFDKDDYQFSRKLYYHVPENYDATKAYPLMVGFRGGPHSNAGEFRSQLEFLSDSLGAIILCPENEAHFGNDEGLVKQLFQYAVDTTEYMYNIDEERIYLTGLSYGGRHAVIVGMDTDFGEIPKIRGIIPFATGRNGQNVPNYDHAAEFPPACICIGQNDSPVFKTVADQLYDRIIKNDGKALLNKIDGIGHTVSFPTYPMEMMKCIRYIESNYGMTRVENPDKSLEIGIFPNPATEYIHVKFSIKKSPFRAYITDITGKIVLNVSDISHPINIKALSVGPKIFVVETNEHVYSAQFLVTKPK